MKRWIAIAAIAFVSVSCNKGNKIYSGPSDNNPSSLSNKISVAEMVTITVYRSLSPGVCAKDSNAGFPVAANDSKILNKCNGLLKTANPHF